jgi:arginine-tRNA-protein transferase
MKKQNSHTDKPDNSNRLRLSFFSTPAHDCSYLEGRQAITLFADPHAELDNHIYSTLSQYGFRRSGKHIYRPSCPTCSACIPVRVPVNEFAPKRAQQRVWKANQDIEVDMLWAEYREEQHALYNKYIQARHPDGGMNDPDPEKYMEFLTSEWSITRFMEFRLNKQLVAVAVLDQLEDGFSAVYTFFDPDLPKRSLGTLGILWSIEFTRKLDLQWLYLGYLIEECRKMRYKSQFQPLQGFIQGHWDYI